MSDNRVATAKRGSSILAPFGAGANMRQPDGEHVILCCLGRFVAIPEKERIGFSPKDCGGRSNERPSIMKFLRVAQVKRCRSSTWPRFSRVRKPVPLIYVDHQSSSSIVILALSSGKSASARRTRINRVLRSQSGLGGGLVRFQQIFVHPW